MTSNRMRFLAPVAAGLLLMLGRLMYGYGVARRLRAHGLGRRQHGGGDPEPTREVLGGEALGHLHLRAHVVDGVDLAGLDVDDGVDDLRDHPQFDPADAFVPEHVPEPGGFLDGHDEAGSPLPLSDPLADRLRTAYARAGEDPASRARALLRLDAVVPPALAANEAFAEAVAADHAAICADGVVPAARALLAEIGGG